jgi:hypothetical protein
VSGGGVAVTAAAPAAVGLGPTPGFLTPTGLANVLADFVPAGLGSGSPPIVPAVATAGRLSTRTQPLAATATATIARLLGNGSGSGNGKGNGRGNGSTVRPTMSSRTAKPSTTAAAAPAPPSPFIFLTWNAENLAAGSKELALVNLLQTNDVSVAVITETEVPTSAGTFDIAGYVSFLPRVDSGDKYRVIAYVRCDVALASDARLAVDIMSVVGLQAVWIRLDAQPPRPGRRAVPALLVGGTYRQWGCWSPTSTVLDRTMAKQRSQLSELLEQVDKAAASSRALVFLGDVNLDALRTKDSSYRHLQMLHDCQAGMARAGLVYHETGATYSSHGHFGASAAQLAAAPALAATSAKTSRTSALDHIYSAGLDLEVGLLPDAASDHRPVTATLCNGSSSGANNERRVIRRRNFKAINSRNLCDSLEKHCVWSDVYAIKGADESLAFIMQGIEAALDDVAPVKAMTVKAGRPLYLSEDTRTFMKLRDAAAKSGDKDRFKHLRNRTTSKVKRDHVRTNVAKLAKARGDPRAIWQIANGAMGKGAAQLPAALRVRDDVMTVGDAAAATLMNEYYISKVAKLKASVRDAPAPPPSSWPGSTTAFSWTYTNAGKVRKIIHGLGSTEALGPDQVPVSVYKKGADVLCGPISHMVNRSLATGVFPDAFKHGVVIPVFKGGARIARSRRPTARCQSSAPSARFSSWWSSPAFRPTLTSPGTCQPLSTGSAVGGHAPRRSRRHTRRGSRARRPARSWESLPSISAPPLICARQGSCCPSLWPSASCRTRCAGSRRTSRGGGSGSAGGTS